MHDAETRIATKKGGDIHGTGQSGSGFQQRLGLDGRSSTPDQPLGPSNKIPCLSKSEKRDAITGRVFLLQQSLEVFRHFRPAGLDGLQKSDGFVVSLSTRSFAKAGATGGVRCGNAGQDCQGGCHAGISYCRCVLKNQLGREYEGFGLLESRLRLRPAACLCSRSHDARASAERFPLISTRSCSQFRTIGSSARRKRPMSAGLLRTT